MAAAAIYNKALLAEIFICKGCSPKDKRKRGCIRPFKKKIVWKIDECVFCFGKKKKNNEKKCKYCQGKGWIAVRRCPRSMSNFTYLPYYLDYRKTGQWPDGLGRLYQPLKLVVAFDVLNYYFTKWYPKPKTK